MVLHNICIEKGDTIYRNLDLTVDSQTNERKPREAIRDQLHITGSMENGCGHLHSSRSN